MASVAFEDDAFLELQLKDSVVNTNQLVLEYVFPFGAYYDMFFVVDL